MVEEVGGSRAALSSRLNWLRAAVLGANDGVVSTAGIVTGVAGATGSRSALLAAGVAGLLAGAMSMAAGEYVSVSTQRDTERAALAKERRELAEDPEGELDELTDYYRGSGLAEELARDVAVALTERDALAAHAQTELGIDPEALTNPWEAALASAAAFTLGALVPLLAVLLPPESWRLAVTVVAVVAALTLSGWASARTGGAGPARAVGRNVAGGLLAMAVTYSGGVLLDRFTG
ncbi:VIT1/CCC1 family predicted Fe2+/Mn2+ transporter [Streptomyces sp. 1114.5]|uniref:VIT1/CCC1 transporter family protein n=1 Tax=unclassified Streptomyces TaxID=2593676 RepID=UPI000BD9B131|nr:MULTISPECIES: VIT family protein [unclassified Streptomyces]RKT18163.1 VIT1/CCC1 family predicted Fe2+/Mn2+ transporter [Streptomyces sp. 1114.5]SOB84362.1 Predicted Fe2+/Mn2+ transporter, VIT1/CCC1 family [Streptomyces sp. 1331.2]